MIVGDILEVNRKLEENIFLKMSFFPKKHPFMRVLRFQEIQFVDTTFPSDTFNAAFGGNFQEPESSCFASCVLDYFNQQNLPMSWWVGPSSFTERADATLISLGMTLDEKETGMVIDLHAMDSKIFKPSELKIIPVRNKNELSQFSGVISHVFSPIDLYAPRFYEKNAPFINEEGGFEFFVGYFEQIPVVVGSLFLGDPEMAGIYDIATLPGYRKRGFGSRMMEVILEEAKRRGYQKAGLLASQEGISIYSKMGFHSYGVFYVYGNKKLLQGQNNK